MPNTDDFRLVQACMRSDRKAQKALYEKYKKSWFMCCLRYADNKMDAEDMLQNAVIAIFSSLKTYDANKAPFSTWAYKVVVNAALQHIRKWRKNDYLTESEASANNYPDQTETIYDKMSARELMDMVQRLPTGYRVVFNLYVMEGYKHHEIAEKLGISISTSKTQLFKARQMLKKQLELLFQNQ